MKLEQQIVSLELSKQLKEAGYPQEGLWWWVKKGNKIICIPKYYFKMEEVFDLPNEQVKKVERVAVAPTVAELGEVLPPIFGTHRRHQGSDGTSQWVCEDNTGMIVFFADTEADCKAKMWLYLKKEKKL